MLYLVLAVAVALAVFGPQLWVRAVMARHGRTIPGMPGTGAELAAHLLEREGLAHVKVERTDPWRDHYDASVPAVRLSPGNFDGKSLTAVAVAVHEVGHALQHRDRDRWFDRRQRLIPFGLLLQQLGIAALGATPIVMLITRSPALGALCGLGGVLALLCKVAIHAVTLPVELDASFNRALPIIVDGQYVAPNEVGAVRQVLRAAALTYIAAAAVDIINVGRWLLLARGRWV